MQFVPTNIHGKGDNYHPTNSHVLPAMVHKFYQAKIKGLKKLYVGELSPKREFLYVDDLAEASIFIFGNISSDNKFLYDFKNNLSEF